MKPFLLLILALSVLTGCASNRFDVPKQANGGGSYIVEVTGTSMNYPVWDNSKHIVQYNWDQIKVGDIVINNHPFYVGLGYCGYMHRVHAPGIVKDGVVMTWKLRGDNNSFNDLWHLFPENYGGTVIKTLDKDGAWRKIQ